MAKNNRLHIQGFAYQTGYEGTSKLLIREMDKILSHQQRKANIKAVEKFMAPYRKKKY